MFLSQFSGGPSKAVMSQTIDQVYETQINCRASFSLGIARDRILGNLISAEFVVHFACFNTYFNFTICYHVWIWIYCLPAKLAKKVKTDWKIEKCVEAICIQKKWKKMKLADCIFLFSTLVFWQKKSLFFLIFQGGSSALRFLLLLYILRHFLIIREFLCSHAWEFSYVV